MQYNGMSGEELAKDQCRRVREAKEYVKGRIRWTGRLVLPFKMRIEGRIAHEGVTYGAAYEFPLTKAISCIKKAMSKIESSCALTVALPEMRNWEKGNE